MAAQLSFNFNIELPAVKKRVRFLVPTYIKFYTVYQYDRLKFTQQLKEWLLTEEGENRTLDTLRIKQEQILNNCWLYDEYGRKKRDSDESHIYRIKTLQKLYTLIYNELGINPFYKFERKELNDLTIWGEEQQAEIKGTTYLSIEDRIKLHIRLLRLLRKGFSIKEAMNEIKRTDRIS